MKAKFYQLKAKIYARILFLKIYLIQLKLLIRYLSYDKKPIRLFSPLKNLKSKFRVKMSHF